MLSRQLTRQKARTARPRRFLDRPSEFRTGLLAMTAVAVGYTLVFSLMAGHGLGPVPDPWVRIPPDRYYSWLVLFGGPTLFAGWLLAAAVGQLWSRAVGGTGQFEDLAATLGVVTALATLATLVPDLVMNAFGIYGGPWSKTWWGWTLAVGWMSAYCLLFLVLYPRAMRTVHQLSRARALLVGLGTFFVYQGFIFVFIR